MYNTYSKWPYRKSIIIATRDYSSAQQKVIQNFSDQNFQITNTIVAPANLQKKCNDTPKESSRIVKSSHVLLVGTGRLKSFYI